MHVKKSFLDGYGNGKKEGTTEITYREKALRQVTFCVLLKTAS